MRTAVGRSPGVGGFWLIALLAAGGLAAALVSQHVYGMEPCPWCVLQRLIVAALGVLAVVAALARARWLALFTALLGLCGVAAALWQHFRAAASGSCALTLADKIVTGLGLDAALPAVFEARASCAEAAVKLLGVPYDFWSLALFALVTVLSVRIVAARR